MSRLRLNPFLVFKTLRDQGLVLDDYFHKRTYSFQSTYVSALVYFLRWQAHSQSTLQLKKLGLSKHLLDELISKNVVIPEKHYIWKLYQRSKNWTLRNHSDSLFYHLNCYQYPFVNYNTATVFDIDVHLMRKYHREGRYPSLYKQYPKNKSIPLPPPATLPKLSLPDIIGSDRQLVHVWNDLQTLSNFLHASFGQTGYTPGLIPAIKKTIPSGGSKHPTEVYVLTFGEWQLPPGVHHYNVKNHALDMIKMGNHLSQLEEAAHQALKIEASAGKPVLGLIYTSIVERAMWRYRDIRSTRAFFIDAGHASQGARFNARAFGLDCVSEHIIRSTSLVSLLKINPYKEPILDAQLFYYPH